MKEIKFRAWDKEKKRWFNGNPQHHICVDDEIVVSVRYKPTIRGSWEPYECRQLTWDETKNLIIMQYTGLKDKNGKEIYEGDIFNYRGQKVIVEYVDDMFHLKSTKYPNLSNGNYRLATLHSSYEIIGNIYENPELLNK